MNLSLKSANKQGILRSTKISRRWLRDCEQINTYHFLRTFESKRYLLNFFFSVIYFLRNSNRIQKGEKRCY